MTVPAFLQELRARDIRVWADGDRLRCNAPAGALTPELRDELQRRKADILAFLSTARELAQRQRAIVPLQPFGTRPPIFGVPGHNGDVFCYGTLAQHLGDNQPFYGLQPPGLDGHGGPLSRIEDLAVYFAAQIRDACPRGAVGIVGYCAGGTTAFELARQLRAQGSTVSLLGLFGAWFPAAYRWPPRMRGWLRDRARGVRRHAGTLTSSSWRARRAYVVANLRARRAQARRAAAAKLDEVLVLRSGVERATIEAIKRYRPSHYAGRVDLFLPSREWPDAESQGLRWRSLVAQADEHYGPTGCDGDNMLRAPYGAMFAALLEECLRGPVPNESTERMETG